VSRALLLRTCFLLTVWIALRHCPAVAQQPDAWQPIPKEDLLLQDNPSDPGSAAMILDRDVYTDDAKRFQTESVRIKVFREEGTKYADIEIPWSGKDLSVDDIRGRTIRQDGSVIEFHGTVFDKIVAKYKRHSYQVKAFTLPGVEPGCIIEYAFTLHWKKFLPSYLNDPHAMFDGGWAIPTTTWVVQRSLFTRHARFILRPLRGGYLRWYTVRLTQGELVRVPDETVKLEVTNVAPLVEEEQMPPEWVLNSRVHFLYVVGFGGDSWDQYGRRMEKGEEKFLVPSKSMQRSVNDIAPTTDAPETRLRKLYARAQQVRNIDSEYLKDRNETKREGVVDNKSSDDVLRHDYGYSLEINMLLVALARAAGFEASLVQVTDRRTSVFEVTVPDPAQLDTFVVQVKVGGKSIYLDPGSRFCPYGILPWFKTDTGGVTWGSFSTAVVKIPAPPSYVSRVERNAEFTLQHDGSLAGKIEITFSPAEAVEHRADALDEDEAGRRKLMEDQVKELLLPGTTVEIDSVSGWESSETPLRVKCHVTVPAYAVLSDQRLLFSTEPFHLNRRPPVSYKSRIQPVSYAYAYERVDKLSITLPDGYRLEALPTDFSADNKLTACHIKRSVEKNVLHSERDFEIKAYYFPPDVYRQVWQTLGEIRKADADNVVLHMDKSLSH